MHCVGLEKNYDGPRMSWKNRISVARKNAHPVFSTQYKDHQWHSSAEYAACLGNLFDALHDLSGTRFLRLSLKATHCLFSNLH